MKRLLLVFTLALFAQSAFAQMGQGYSTYTNYGADASNLYVTAVVDGSTNCNNIPPGWNCALIRHTGKVFVTIAGVQTESQGSPVTPNSYISVSNTGTKTNPQPGTQYPVGTIEEIVCTVAGTIFVVDGSSFLSLTYSAYSYGGVLGGQCLWLPTCKGTCTVDSGFLVTPHPSCYQGSNKYAQCYDAFLQLTPGGAGLCFAPHAFCTHQPEPGICN